MEQQIPLPKQDYMVNISCMTYNHEDYIEEALKGFVMQKTNFPFCALVIDDASTDGTAEIIRQYEQKYPEIIKGVYLTENHYSIKKSKIPYYRPWRERSKYIAICEGDDYWTDPLKLQKQVDFLEANPEYVMCFTNATQHYENSDIPDTPFSSIENREYSGEEILRSWIVPTGSVIFKRLIMDTSLYQTAMSNNKLIFKDITIFLSCAESGKIRGAVDFTSVYRRTDVGAVSTQRNTYEGKMKYAIHTLEIYKVFGEKYRTICERIFYEHCYIMIQQYLKELNLTQAYRFLQYSWSYSPKFARGFYFHKIKQLPLKCYKHLLRT